VIFHKIDSNDASIESLPLIDIRGILFVKKKAKHFCLAHALNKELLQRSLRQVPSRLDQLVTGPEYEYSQRNLRTVRPKVFDTYRAPLVLLSAA
jgi:hypothetical protein